MRLKRERGHGKHRTVGRGEEEPWFKKRRAKNRAKAKIVKKSKQRNRRKAK